MTDRVRARLDRADEAVAAARRDLAAGSATFAVERAYYAMFYAADALLATRGLAFSSHGALLGAFGREFARTGDLDPELHRWLLDAFDARQEAAYDLDPAIGEDAAREILGRAVEFVARARAYVTQWEEDGG